MVKSKVISFCPGDNVEIYIKAKFDKYTLLRIDAIEITDMVSENSDKLNIDLNK